jgi:hypothetical protein
MHIEQDNHVPAPLYVRYPFNQLKPGQAVTHACADSRARDRARKAAYRLAEYKGWQITVRSLPEGIRVWRHE